MLITFIPKTHLLFAQDKTRKKVRQRDTQVASHGAITAAHLVGATFEPLQESFKCRFE